DQPLDPLAHCCLRQPDRLADRRVRAAPILLQLLDDLLGDVVKRHAVAPSIPAARIVAQAPARHSQNSRLVRHATASCKAMVPLNRYLSTDSVEDTRF